MLCYANTARSGYLPQFGNRSMPDAAGRVRSARQSECRGPKNLSNTTNATSTNRLSAGPLRFKQASALRRTSSMGWTAGNGRSLPGLCWAG